MNDRLFGTQTIESQSRSNFVGLFYFILFYFILFFCIVRFGGTIHQVCPFVVCVCVALEFCYGRRCAPFIISVDCRKWATLWSVVLLAIDKCWPTVFFFRYFLIFRLSFSRPLMFCRGSWILCGPEKKKKRCRLVDVSSTTRERERNLSSSNQLE